MILSSPFRRTHSGGPENSGRDLQGHGLRAQLSPEPDDLTGVYGIPGAVQRYLAGRDFPAVTEDGVPCGTIRVYAAGNSGWYPPFLRSQGDDEGDILLARFSLPKSSVILSIIDDDALEDLSPAV